MVQIWSRDTPESGVNETLVLHRVDPSYRIEDKFEFEVVIELLLLLYNSRPEVE